MPEFKKIKLNGTDYDINGSGSGLTDSVKNALLTCFEKVAWIDENGQDYYDALYSALYPPANLVSISCVYTQSGAVYTTDALDLLRSDLVVTAHYDDSSTATITTYTLSGTLAEGTSTITVSYGGKTATFNVTVTEYTTAPIIALYDSSFNASGVVETRTGGCITAPYEYELPIDAFKETTYYDSENNYSSLGGGLWKLTYCFQNTNGVAFSSGGKTCLFDTSDAVVQISSTNKNGTVNSIGSDRYNAKYFTLSDNKVRLRFTLATADIDNSYAYWIAAQNTQLLPVGVSAGDIIFAGRNTPYFGLRNINEAT